MLVSNALKSGDIKAHYNNNYVPLPGVDHSAGKKVFIHKNKANDFNDIFKNRRKNFNLTYIFKQLSLLKGPGLIQSLFHKASASSRILPFEGGQIRYAAFEGSLYVDEISITGALGVDSKHPAGTYKVKKRDGGRLGWEPDMDQDERAEQIGYINTKHLAVSGYSNNLRDAARYMPDFIEHGFGKGTLNNTYSLFYTPTKGVINSAYSSLKDDLEIKDLESAKKLAVVFEQLAKKEQEINLTIHGSGHYVFKSALKKLSQRNIQLPNVTVYYANATANLTSVDQKRRQAGMKLTEKAPLINPASLQQQYFSGNIFSAPMVAARAKPDDAIAKYFNAASSLPTSVSSSLIASLAVGSARPLERNVIENTGQAINQGSKLIWDSVHKMMVRG